MTRVAEQLGTGAPETSVRTGARVEPKLCGGCEYFDGSGKRANGQWVDAHGDCLNPLSGRYQTTVKDTCRYWFPDSTLAEPTE